MIELIDTAYRYPHQAAPAVEGIRLAVRPGEAILCTGASGSGKSTLVRLLNGLAPHFYKGSLSGRVRVSGEDTAALSLQDVARQVGTLFQDPEHQFFALNVEDEIAAALEWQGMAPAEIARRIREMADRFGLHSILESSVHSLSEGQKQKVALAGVLARRPSVLVLDEPTANLDPESTVELAGILKSLKDEGIALVVVDHRLYWLEGLIDEAVVMENGEVAHRGPFADLHDDALRGRFGLRATRVADPRSALAPLPKGEGHVGARGVRFGYEADRPLFDGLSFDLQKGAVVGLLGPNGAGKTTLARLMVGLLRLRQGEVRIEGRAVRPGELLARSSIVLQNMDHQLHMRSVRQELLTAAGSERSMRCVEDADRLLARFNLAHLAERHPQSLSGGEKQRLVIACGMIRRPEILILDEPTSGLDGRNMTLIADSLDEYADEGGVVLVISHDLELLERTCRYRLDLTQPGQDGRTD